jgi:hypothetical protein
MLVAQPLPVLSSFSSEAIGEGFYSCVDHFDVPRFEELTDLAVNAARTRA